MYSNAVDELVCFSREHRLTHVPSALSMLTYVKTLFDNKLIEPYNDKIVIGKPFGSQAYYLTWKNLGFIEEIEHLSVGVKHAEIDFVDYGEETMGNALGVGIGIAMANPDKLTWVNITDATLQMGSTIEAIQFIGHNVINNIVVTVDYNNLQVTGSTSDVLRVNPIINLCKEYNWIVHHHSGHEPEIIKRTWSRSESKPRIYFYDTVKGFGVDYMVEDPVLWHYKVIE